MIGIHPLHSAPIKPSCRPFRRRRHNVFTGWEKLFSHCWERIATATQTTHKVTQSLLGKVVVYSLADTGGAIAGSALGSTILGNMGSDIGRGLVSIGFLGAMAGSGILVLKYASLEKTRKIYLTAMIATTIGLMIITSSNERGKYGAWLGRLIGEEVGSFVGTILGGFALLNLAGSPTVFFDQHHPWDSYSTSTARFLVVGRVFESVIVKPSIPLIGLLLRILRKITCIALQNFAYNSNTLISLVVESLKRRTFAKPRFSAFAKMAINTYCGHNTKFFEEEFSRFSLKKIFPTLATHQFNLIRKFDRFLLGSLIDEIKYLAEHSDRVASKAISAFHEYMELLTGSKELIEAHEKFRKALLDKTGEHLQYKEKIIQLIREKISGENPTLWNQISQSIVDYGWTSDNAQHLLKTLDELIMQMEISLVGLPLTDPRQASYLTEVFDVYLQHYLIFLLFKYPQLEALTPEQEEQSIATLMNLIFNHYVKPILPESIAKLSYRIITGSLKTALKTQNSLTLFFRQPEQASYIHSSQEMKLIENYAEIDLTKIDPADSFEMVESET